MSDPDAILPGLPLPAPSEQRLDMFLDAVELRTVELRGRCPKCGAAFATNDAQAIHVTVKRQGEIHSACGRCKQPVAMKQRRLVVARG